MRSEPAIRPSPDSAATVSIVVVTYNSAETIGDCLDSFAAISSCAEVIVVDNASTDASAQIVTNAHPTVRLVANSNNEGFARAVNRGWRLTSAPFVLILNPDTQLCAGAVDALLDLARQHPRAALVGPRILNVDGSLQHSCFHFPNLRMAVTGFFGLIPLDSPENGRYTTAEYEQPHQVEHLLGACLLVRREAVEQVGLLDERFFMYFEETDWCYRMRAAGWENWYTPFASVVHRGGHSASREPERMSAEFYRSQARFYRKHYPWLNYIALKLLSALGVSFWTARTTRGLLRGRVSRELLTRRLASYWAILWA